MEAVSVCEERDYVADEWVGLLMTWWFAMVATEEEGGECEYG